jgi:hypothetical protein
LEKKTLGLEPPTVVEAQRIGTNARRKTAFSGSGFFPLPQKDRVPYRQNPENRGGDHRHHPDHRRHGTNHTRTGRSENMELPPRQPNIVAGSTGSVGSMPAVIAGAVAIVVRLFLIFLRLSA